MPSPLRSLGKALIPKRFHAIVSRLIHRQKPAHVDLRWQLRTGLRLSILSHGDWVIYNDVFVDGEYDAPIQRAIQRRTGTEPLNVLDLGANVGFFTLRFIDLLRRSGQTDAPYRLTLVEGSPRVARELETRIAQADDLSRSVRVIHGLVGKREGVGKIAEGDFHPMNTTMSEELGGVRVSYVDLAGVIPPGTRIDLLKCDIEGAELQFIENYGDLLKDVQSAVFELHPEICDTERCIQLLAAAGLTHQELLRKETDFSVVYFWR